MKSSYLCLAFCALLIFGGMTFYGVWFVRIMGSNVVRTSDHLASPLK